jgi:hypothetical protein
MLSTGGVEAGETGWLVASQRFTEANLRELARSFDDIEARAERERHEEQLRADRDAPPDQELIREAAEEARAAREEHESKRPERVEALLERIAHALESRAR